MNVNINATLIVQAINFFIAYLLFRFLFLKPAYQAIEQEDQQCNELESLVKHDRLFLETVKQKQLDQWQECKEYCKSYAPKLYEQALLFRGIAPKITYTPVSSQELHAMKVKLAQAIVSRIGVSNGKR